MPDDVERKPDADESESAEGIGVAEAREVLGDLVLRAAYGNERVMITRKGRASAALIGMKDLERLRQLDERDAQQAQDAKEKVA